ncbi:MAG TPA: acyl-CoA dehydrogenase family protein [Myxococcota bacterium]|jgi:hypothetical protein|nr:acyl-CoA dehydrogenase family protein [Myxococcota bacterium]
MFEFTEQQIMVQRMVRQWAEKELAPALEDLESERVPPYELMRKFRDTFGLTGVVKATFRKMIDKEKKKLAAAASGNGGGGGGGGGGGTALAQSGALDAALAAAPDGGADDDPMRDPSYGSIIAIELSRWSPGFVMAMGATVGLAGGAIMSKGTVQQKERFAYPLLTMEKIGAWGMTEPGSGSDAFGSMRTVARREGADFVLNGSKTFITNAPYADTFVIYARMMEDGKPSSRVHGFICERGMKGLTTSKSMRKMGMHSSPTGEVFLEDVRVPADQLLGENADAPARDQAKDTFHGERTGILAMSLGIIERCLDDSTRYAKERVQWGKPIGEFQLIQEKLARMFVARENVRNLLFKQWWMVKNGKKMTMPEACACKLYSARMATEVAMEAVQIHGGNGYMREFHVEQLARDAKLLQIGGGTDEIQIVTIARGLLRD